MNTILPVSNAPVSDSPWGEIIRVTWQQQSPPPHEFTALACPEDEDGGYSIFAVHYPGVVSQGETLEEAKANIAEAFLAMLEAIRKRGEKMAFSHAPVVDATPACVWLRINVDG